MVGENDSSTSEMMCEEVEWEKCCTEVKVVTT